jgi:cbb3-type cytochrome oxidase maturation protein
MGSKEKGFEKTIQKQSGKSISNSNTKRMSVIIILLIVSILIAGGFLMAFIWSVKTGQFDDDYSPSRRILFEPEESKEENKLK